MNNVRRIHNLPKYLEGQQFESYGQISFLTNKKSEIYDNITRSDHIFQLLWAGLKNLTRCFELSQRISRKLGFPFRLSTFFTPEDQNNLRVKNYFHV